MLPVYPRWRGEHQREYPLQRPGCGLSPLARGTRHSLRSYGWRHRFIPAGAGNTLKVMFEFIRSPVYPRWRGEHITVSRPGCIEDGLSPLARGTPNALCREYGNERFIPAGAGNTSSSSSSLSSSTVYPRWRGEHVRQARKCGTGIGLSPLARGTPGVTCERIYQSRFIPAGAGNTNVTHRAGYRVPVYPRWRGEHDRSTIISPLASGLSPLARGTQDCGRVQIVGRRFIPAGAGNTKVRRGMFD